MPELGMAGPITIGKVGHYKIVANFDAAENERYFMVDDIVNEKAEEGKQVETNNSSSSTPSDSSINLTINVGGSSGSKLLQVNMTQTIRLNNTTGNLTLYPIQTNWDSMVFGEIRYPILDENNKTVSYTGFSDLMLQGLRATCTEPYFVRVTGTDATAKEGDGIQLEKTTGPVQSAIYWGGSMNVNFEQPQSSVIRFVQTGYGIFPAD